MNNVQVGQVYKDSEGFRVKILSVFSSAHFYIALFNTYNQCVAMANWSTIPQGWELKN